MGKSRYFIAVIPPGGPLGKAESLKHDLRERFGLRAALRSPAHITLHRPFEWKTANEPRLIDTLRRFELERPIPIVFDGFGHFGASTLFIAVRENPGLDDLYERMRRFARRELGLLNEWTDGRGFHPHMTVAFRDLRKAQFADVKAYLETKEYHEKISADLISLLKFDGTWRVVSTFGGTPKP